MDDTQLFDSIVERTRELHDMALRGELSGVFIIAMKTDNSNVRSFVADSDIFAITGAIEQGKLDFMRNKISQEKVSEYI